MTPLRDFLSLTSCPKTVWIRKEDFQAECVNAKVIDRLLAADFIWVSSSHTLKTTGSVSEPYQDPIYSNR